MLLNMMIAGHTSQLSLFGGGIKKKLENIFLSKWNILYLRH